MMLAILKLPSAPAMMPSQPLEGDGQGAPTRPSIKRLR
jgi:hypothetical protein